MMSFQFGYKNVFMGFASTDTKCFASIENADRSVITSGGSKGGREGRAPTPLPPRGPNYFNFMQFLGNFGKIICWRPPGSWRPLLGEILDPPLITVCFQKHECQFDFTKK